MQLKFTVASVLLLAASAVGHPASPNARGHRVGQDTESTNAAIDDNRIEWVLPGDFETARRRAKEEGRLIVIKGISFGVDQEGATCATAGTW